MAQCATSKHRFKKSPKYWSGTDYVVGILFVLICSICHHFIWEGTSNIEFSSDLELRNEINLKYYVFLYYRSVEPQERSLSLGFQTLIARSIGTVPGPIVFGYIIDQTCLLWSQNKDCSIVNFHLFHDCCCRLLLGCKEPEVIQQGDLHLI